MAEKSRVHEFLSSIEAFSQVSPETLDKLASAFHERSCHPGEVVICQGARSKDLCLVLEGELSVTVKDDVSEDHSQELEEEAGGNADTGREVAILKPGDLFGEIGVVSGIQASATVAASMEGLPYLDDR